jgi:DNA-binding NarL/FixJ family response regulator
MRRVFERQIRVLLGEGQALVLAGLERLLGEAGDIAVIGCTTSGRKALRLVLDERPDVALLDVDLGESSAIAVLQELQGQGSHVPVIVLSGHTDRHYVQQALVAGARGYVLKQGTSANLLNAIRSVHAGGLYLDPEMAEICVAAAPPRVEHAAPRIAVRPLTAREEEVIRLIALGFTAKEIGGKLGINARSVETHKSRASDKLGLRSRAKIVQYGVLRGWFQAAVAVMACLCLDAPGAAQPPLPPGVEISTRG